MDFKKFYDALIFDVDRSMLKSYRGKQGDTKSRGIYVTIAQQNVVVEELAGLSMRLFYEKPDKTRGFIDGVIDDGKFIIDYTNQMYAVPGVVKAELRLSGTDGEIISNKTFQIVVDANIADNSIVSKDERGILDRAFELAEDIIPRIELLDVELLEDVQDEMFQTEKCNVDKFDINLRSR
jgi:RNase P/RNase MRP subunit p29